MLLFLSGLLLFMSQQGRASDLKSDSGHPSKVRTTPLAQGEVSQLSAISQVYVRKFTFEGNTVFDDNELSKLTKRYEERIVSAEEIQTVKELITQHYVLNGYINSGATIPDQQVQDGIVTLRVIEGVISKIKVTGIKRLKESYIIDRLENITQSNRAPLNVNRLQDALKLLKQDVLIENISGDLSPGLELGQAVLVVAVKEANRYHLTLGSNNHKPPSVGSYVGTLKGELLNTNGWGDIFRAEGGLTKGLNEVTLSYQLPLNSKDTILSFDYEETQSEIISEPFNQLDINGKSESYGVSIKHPVYKRLTSEFDLILEFEQRESDTTLLGVPFSFSAGVVEGKSKVSVIRFSQQWVYRSLRQVIGAYSSFGIGVDVGDVTIHEDKDPDKWPDGQFYSWVGQFQWLREFKFLESQLLASMSIQLANEPLLALERFSIGGSSTVRGYRENQLTSDNGLVTSIEWRIPVMQYITGPENVPKYGDLRFIPFFDFGKAWNSGSFEDPAPNSIYSLGLGLRWDFRKRIHARLYWGIPLRSLDGKSHSDLQDNGIHFQIGISFSSFEPLNKD